MTTHVPHYQESLPWQKSEFKPINGIILTSSTFHKATFYDKAMLHSHSRLRKPLQKLKLRAERQTEDIPKLSGTIAIKSHEVNIVRA